MTAIRFLTILMTSFIGGCSGEFNYTPPRSPEPVNNTVVINQPFDAVWERAIPSLGTSFFVINNLERDSGLINVEYSGDPEQYIDCGRLRSTVSNARGERVYDFPLASAQEIYEVMDPGQGINLTFIDRRLQLLGRANIIFEEAGTAQTRVTVNARYVVERTVRMQAVSGETRVSEDTLSFNSGGADTFGDGETRCVANGSLEQDVLELITGT